MRPALQDAAGLQHQDLVGVDHGREAVRDDQRGAAGGDALERFLERLLGAAVQGRSGLVEDEDRRVLQEHAGDGDALLLAAGELEAALADRGGVALGQAGDEVVDLGGPGRGLDLGLGGTGAAVGDVLGDGVVEEHGVLRHHADRATQGELRDCAHVLAVDRDPAARDLVEAEQEAHQRRLARTGGPDHGDLVAGRDDEAHLVQDRPARVVGKAHRLEADRAALDLQGPCVRRVGDLGLERQEAVDVLEVGQGLAQLAVDHAQEVERHVELEEEGVDQHDVAHAQRSGDDVAGGRDHDRGDPGGDDRGLAHVEEGERLLRLDRRPLVAGERAVEAGALVVLVGEGLDHLVVDQPVDGGGAELVVALVHLAPKARAPVRREDGKAGVGGHGDEGDGGERERVAREQDAQYQDELEDRGAEAEQAGLEEKAHRVHAALDRAAELARAPVQVVAQGELEQVLVNPERQASARTLADFGEDRVPQLGEGGGSQARRPVRDEGCDRDRRQTRAAHLIDHGLEEEGDRDVDELGHDQKAQRHQNPQAQPGLVPRPQIGPDQLPQVA